jgi:hypothetical protein
MRRDDAESFISYALNGEAKDAGTYLWWPNQRGGFVILAETTDRDFYITIFWPEPEDVHQGDIDIRPLYAVAGWCQRWGKTIVHKPENSAPDLRSRERISRHWADRDPDFIYAGRSFWRVPHDHQRLFTSYLWSEVGPYGAGPAFDIRQTVGIRGVSPDHVRGYRARPGIHAPNKRAGRYRASRRHHLSRRRRGHRPLF